MDDDTKAADTEKANRAFLELMETADIFEELFRRFPTIVIVAARTSQDNAHADSVVRAFSGGQAAAIGLLTIAKYEMLDNGFSSQAEDDDGE